MALTVEDGTIVSGANSYLTVAEWAAYWALRGVNDLGLVGCEGDDEANLVRAFDAINRNWSYLGHPISDTQPGAFPRNCFSGVPQQIKDAQAEMAYLIRNGADPMATIEDKVEREKIGPLEVEYSTGTGRASYTAVTTLLRGFTGVGVNNVRIMRA